MGAFDALLAEIKNDCAWENVPYDKISALARRCGPDEVRQLIRELDALDDADLEGDAGDGIDEYWRLRTAYSQALAEVEGPAIESLLQALASENPNTRAYSARALGMIGTRRAFEPVVSLLANETDDVIRMSLIEALGGVGDERAVPVLLRYLKAPAQVNRGWIIRVAANALGKLGTEAVIQPLAEVLATDSDWFARLGAAEGLRKIKHSGALAALCRGLDDRDARVRGEAAAGLQELAGSPLRREGL
jgi:HEAT repeat protein